MVYDMNRKIVCKMMDNMSMWLRKIIILLSVGAAAGCSTMPGHVALHKEETSLHRIGVISLLGDDARFYRAGPLLLPTEHKFLSVPQWQIDSYAQKVVRNALADRYTYVPLHYDAKTLEDSMEVGNTETFDLNRIKDRLRKIVHGSADAVVLIVPTTEDDLISGQSEPLVGYGMYRLTMMSQQIGAPYVGVKVIVLDARTLKPISQHAESKYTSYYTAGWNDDFKDMPAQQRRRVEHDIKALLAKELKIGLKQVGLSSPESTKSTATKNAKRSRSNAEASGTFS